MRTANLNTSRLTVKDGKMWDFTEKDVEKFLVPTKKRTKRTTMAVDGISYIVVFRPQHRLGLPEESRPNPQRPLFKALEGLKEFLPLVDEKVFIPDIIAFRKVRGQRGNDPESSSCVGIPPTDGDAGGKPVPGGIGEGHSAERPKSQKELVVFELKNQAATVKDVAQLRGYMNILKYFLDNDIGAIRKELRVRGKVIIRGVLLARSIPEKVWLATSIPDGDSRPDLDLIAYELVSNKKERKIEGITFVNFSELHKEEFRKRARQYKTCRKRRKAAQMELSSITKEVENAIGGRPQGNEPPKASMEAQAERAVSSVDQNVAHPVGEASGPRQHILGLGGIEDTFKDS